MRLQNRVKIDHNFLLGCRLQGTMEEVFRQKGKTVKNRTDNENRPNKKVDWTRNMLLSHGLCHKSIPGLLIT